MVCPRPPTVDRYDARIHVRSVEAAFEVRLDSNMQLDLRQRGSWHVAGRRRRLPYLSEQPVIFPSTAGTLRDPKNFGKQWRTVRERLGVPGVNTHSFRKTVATLIDDEGVSARIGADHLGHSKVSARRR
jgi:integrase